MVINNKPSHFFSAGLLFLLLAVSAGNGLEALSLALPLSQSSTSANQKLSPQEIIQAAAENGKVALAALREYTYYAQLTIETVSQADTITGKYYRLTEFYFDRDGNRQERVIESTSKLPDDGYIGTTTANNLIRIYQFMITPETLARYEFNYVGREQLDELSTYVFDVEPKVKVPGSENNQERYLKGRVWIDDQDLSVVKVAGDALPEQNTRRTPRFETYFQNEGKYWFPSYSSAEDRIQISKYPARVIVKLRFSGYKKVKSKG
jgi:hypothetical protein